MRLLLACTPMNHEAGQQLPTAFACFPEMVSACVCQQLSTVNRHSNLVFEICISLPSALGLARHKPISEETAPGQLSVLYAATVTTPAVLPALYTNFAW